RDADDDRAAERVLTGEREDRVTLIHAEQPFADPDDEPGGEQQPDDEEHDAEHAVQRSQAPVSARTRSRVPGHSYGGTGSSTLGSTMPTRTVSLPTAGRRCPHR